jgi:hypothetical protein
LPVAVVAAVDMAVVAGLVVSEQELVLRLRREVVM